MDYVFNEKIFKETFNVQEPDTKSQDVYRLRHNPNKKFKLFPYKANGKIHIVYEMEEIISDFFKLALGIETEDVLMDDLCQKMRKKLVISKEDEPIFEKTVKKMFFQDGKFVAKNIGLHICQSKTENKSIEDLAFFVFSVLGLDDTDSRFIQEAIEKYPYNVMESLVVDSIESIQKEYYINEKKYFVVIKGIQEKFKCDFHYMLANGMTEPEDISKLLDLYYFYYVTQTCVTLDNFGYSNRDKRVDFYYALDWEKVSGNRKCCVNGWEQLQQKINHLFCHSITLELINQHRDENLMYDYIMIQEYIGEDMEKDLLVAEEIKKVEKAYTDCIGDYKKFDEIAEQSGINDTDRAIKHLFKCVEEQFLNTERKRANRFYIEKFEEYAKNRWLKNRRKSGIVLNLTEQDIIFLTKISIRDAEKIRLNELFKEYEARGIFLDQTSRKYLQEFFAKLNLIDKKSDSGDAQYVKRIL